MKKNYLLPLIFRVSAILIILAGTVHAAEGVAEESATDADAAAAADAVESAAKQGANGTKAKQPPEQNIKSPEQEKITLETAYKREYAFLDAQKRELAARLKHYQSNTRSEEQALSNKIKALERESIERSAKIDQLNTLLAEAERKEAAAFERSDTLEITYAQAESTLKNHEIVLPASLMESKGNDQTKVGFIFDKALSLVRDLGAIQTTKGDFFLENGKQTQGEIIRLGNIAAYGISSEGRGSLVPAGGGDLKIWKEPGAEESALAISKNQQPDILRLFLFESRTTSIDEAAEKTILEIINSGGIIGWIIVSLGVLAIFLVLIRTYLLKKNSSNTQQISEQVIRQVTNGDFEAAKKSCQAGSTAIARVLTNTLNHLKDDRDHMESVVHEAILRESGPLESFGSAIIVIASISPLLGLLGTVTGMIATFDVITEFGTGDPKLLSGGISIALVTTELGLTVAIPTLLAGSLLAAWAKDIKRDMEHAALRVTNAFLGGQRLDHTVEPSKSDATLIQSSPAN